MYGWMDGWRSVRSANTHPEKTLEFRMMDSFTKRRAYRLNVQNVVRLDSWRECAFYGGWAVGNCGTVAAQRLRESMHKRPLIVVFSRAFRSDRVRFVSRSPEKISWY